MTKTVEAVGEYDCTFTDCLACDEKIGLTILRQYVMGVRPAQEERIIEMRERMHEQATGHQVLIVHQRRPQ